MSHNASKEPIKVLHSALERWGDSAYKSKCPACKDGILLIYRFKPNVIPNREILAWVTSNGTQPSNDLYKLLRHDRCVSCGQQVIYTDETINGETLMGAVEVNEQGS
jgi:hypothetical protein